jgi:PAS domain S-box-containing protein
MDASPAKPQIRRVLLLRCNQNYPPYEFVEHGQPTGFNLDLIRAIAEEMNLQLRIVPGPWEEVRNDLERGKIDLVPGMYYSSARREKVDFTLYHSVIFHDIFAPNDSAIHALKDLRGRVVGVQRGSNMHDFLLHEKLTTRLVTVQDPADLLKKLERHEIDAALMSKIEGMYFIRHLHIRGVRPVGEILAPQRYGFAVRKGDTELVELLNQGLALMRYNGRFDELNEKWFDPYQEKTFWQNSRQIFVLVLLLLLALGVFLVWTLSLQQEVERRTRELRQIIDLVPHMIFACDTRGRLFMANSAVAQAFGRTVTEILGQPAAALLPASPPGPLFGADAEVIKNGQPKYLPEAAVTLVDGMVRIHQVTKIPFRLSHASAKAVLTVAVDITDLKGAELALRESFRFNQEIISHAGEGIIVYDHNLVYRVWNHFMEELTGLSAETVLGTHPATHFLHWQQPDFLEKLLRVFQGETVAFEDFIFTAQATGRSGHISAVYVPHRDAAGEIQGVIGVIHDLTQRKKLEAQLQQSQKMEAVGHLAGGIAHDFNNLLTPILGYTDLLLLQAPPGSKPHEALAAIQDAAQRASSLTRQLLAFSLKQVLDLKSLDLNQEINLFRPMLRTLLGETIDIQLRLGENLPSIRADASQIHQVLMNLAINARDAMPHGGTLIFQTAQLRPESADPREFGGREPMPGIHLSVTDNGVGMDAETLARVFEPFFTTKPNGRGTGLGLATVYGIMKQHGGFIFPKSQKDVGTTFQLFFPQAGAPEELSQETASSHPVVEGKHASGHELILLVEDEDLVRELAREILLSHGYRVLAAQNGAQALALAQNQDTPVDLLLTDVIMPGLNGKQLYQQLKQVQPHLPVLYMSGYAQDVIAPEGILEPGTRLLAKPFAIPDFLNAVHDLLHPDGTSPRMTNTQRGVA